MPWGDFSDLSGVERDDLDASLEVFRNSARIIVSRTFEQRPACEPAAALVAAAEAALSSDGDGAAFFRRWFHPIRLRGPGFLTGYYEVEVEARREPDAEFSTPILARPDDLVTLNDAPLGRADGAALTSARRRADGALEPYPERRAIEDEEYAGKPRPIAYLRDRVELFLIQVQGSARLRFPDGSLAALTYDGRNGHPYTSIGRLMIARGLVSEEDMSLARLKATLREMGLGPGGRGRELMQENKSYVFFRFDLNPERRQGPIGGQGCALTPLRSIAVDRTRWSYGLPFFICGRIPWEGGAPSPFARLMIAQDTGSAILG
ncbi:MAG TPA: murein transglycosylase A, partial [Methylocystis sp.]|nr:murein transglycosylase A [Methylocystis sp.]